MDFEKICMLFTMEEPYYGIILSSMERVATQKIETLGVTRSGNVFRLYYNPDFVNRFNTDTVLELIRHEVLHICLNHFTIWDGEDEHDTPEMHKLRNIAADLEVNSYLKKQRMQKEVGALWAEDFGWDKMLGTREYLRLILNNQPKTQSQQANAQSPSQPCNGGQGSGQQQKQSQPQQNQNQNSQQNAQPSTPDNSNQGVQPQQQVSKEYADSFTQFDDHSQWPDTMDENEAEQIKQTIEDMMVFAAEEVEKAHGDIPGELAGKIKMLREKKRPKPVADWKRYFRRYLGNEFSEFIRKSKKRESRRFPDAAGNRHRRKSNILVGIDTSGSVSMPEYREFFSQIKTLSQVANFHVIECDSRIQYEYDYKGKPNDTLHGGGGTSFVPVVDRFNKNKRLYDALVYFTDGYCEIPRDTPKDTLWVISSNGDQSNRAKYKVNGASVAFIPKKQ